MLVLTMTLMGVASFAIGLLPTYATIGVLAPILLILLRLIQGFAVGGEWGGAALMALEHSDENKRGFSASFANMGAPAGAVLSTVVLAIVTLLPDDAFLTWGWRIPFLLSAVLVGIGLYVRLKVTESPLFEQEVITAVASEKKRLPIVVRAPRQPDVRAAGHRCRPRRLRLQALMATFALTIGVAGRPGPLHRPVAVRGRFLRADLRPAGVRRPVRPDRPAPRHDRRLRRRDRRGLSRSCCSSPPARCSACCSGSSIAMPLVQAAMYGPLAAFTTEIFATGNRYTGASLGYQLSSTLGGGFAPLIAATLVAGTTAGNGLFRVALFAAARRPDQRHHHRDRQGIQQAEPDRRRLTAFPTRRAGASDPGGLGTTHVCVPVPAGLRRC